MRGWYDIGEVARDHAQLNCGKATCRARTCFRCKGEVDDRFWQPLTAMIPSTVYQIQKRYRNHSVVDYDGNNFHEFISKWIEVFKVQETFRKGLSEAGYSYLRKDEIIEGSWGTA